MPDLTSSLWKRWKVGLTGLLILWILRLLRLTYRFEYRGRGNFQASLEQTRSILIGLGHENSVGGVLGHAYQDYYPLASLTDDGELISQILKRLGFKPLRGSSSRGALAARRQLIDILGRGAKVAITLDGPRGPRRVPKRGIFDISRRSGVPILPLRVSTTSPWILKKSWDQFQIPKPFSKIILSYEPLIFVSEQGEFADSERTLLSALADGC